VTAVVGAVLAGGAGRRLGGRKATALLGGRPLAAWPAEALGEVCDRVAVVAKARTRLPELPGTERWDEPDEPRHPLTGIVYALERAGAPVLVCAADMPFVTADACRTLLSAAMQAGSPLAAVAAGAGELQPVFGVYSPAALEPLRAAEPDSRLVTTVEALDPVRVALPPSLLRNVNTREELEAAEAALSA
jgi:molybdopterin-guanine dinucleotide biosynthesis protein A